MFALAGDGRLRRAVGHHLTVRAQDDDAVDDGQPGLGAVLHHDHGGAAGVGGRGHRVPDLEDSFGVQIRGGFVEQDQARVHRQHPGECQALLLAARQSGGVLRYSKIQTDGVEGGVDARPDRCAWHREVLHAERHVVAHPRQDHLRIRVLQHHSDAAASIGGADTVDEEATRLVSLVGAAQ